MAKKATKTGLDLKEFNNEWARLQGELEALAHEQVSADIDLVEATRALQNAKAWTDQAIKRKTLAEKRLNTVRGNLGAPKGSR